MTVPDDPERIAIQNAAQRLLDGTPLRSSGALTIVALAAEAEVKRWLLTHKHRDLAEGFQARAKAAGGDPPPVVELKARIRDLAEANAQLRRDNAEQRELTRYYANVINELATALDRATASRDEELTNVRPITNAPSRKPTTRATSL